MEIHVSEEWDVILDFVTEEKGIVLFLGATDTGKSTLVKHLLSRFDEGPYPSERSGKGELCSARLGQTHDHIRRRKALTTSSFVVD